MPGPPRASRPRVVPPAAYDQTMVHIPRRDAPPSVHHVAARAGVSLATVSNVLNHPERVAEGTAARVRDAIAALGYTRTGTRAHSCRDGPVDRTGGDLAPELAVSPTW